MCTMLTNRRAGKPVQRISTIAIMEADIPCGMCSSKASKCCDACKAMSYCSIICVKADWPVHILLCTSNPHPDLRLAQGDRTHYGILFPEKEQAPRFVGFRGWHS